MNTSTQVGFQGLAPVFSRHALLRMQQRTISHAMVESVMLYGREVRGHDTVIHVVGRRDARCWRMRGVRLDHLEGIHVVCSGDGVVITVYRNREFRGVHELRRMS